MLRVLVALTAAVLLSGCAGFIHTPAERIDAQAREAGFQPVTTVTGPLKAWLRTAPGAHMDAPLTVYIEGDGAQWRGPYDPPNDPTPRNALTLRLALRDPGARVAYLGRPCQNLSTEALAQCPRSFWVTARYSDAAVSYLNSAIDVLALSASASRVQLVGFSGGGAVALLLAARRADVECVVTLASPLDTNAWTSALDLTPLSRSLNPLDFAGRLRYVAQTHFSGADDKVVPTATLKEMIAMSPYARVEAFDGYDHECCWVLAWQALRKRTCLAR